MIRSNSPSRYTPVNSRMMAAMATSTPSNEIPWLEAAQAPPVSAATISRPVS